ncbi:hypothetical protein [Hydrogenophaga sp. BPS33]|uniref:hypothetical protein n=1 Tax=Hydrogenophaga sp. BPS33 TaxID=2651974 RepID=UPI00131FAB54|nr:hypothetical protein [Hydrogenophaga sp. BPS33]QHE83717.1 hypothetical protein F9K07_01890 [Hydrogenophaga sp. BPS33]
MGSSEIFAIAAHLHVLLRRKTGRVTDTEWMATNGDYAREVVRFAREKATEENLPDLLPWAEKLEMAIPEMEKPRSKTLFESAAEAIRNASTSGDRYIGRLR